MQSIRALADRSVLFENIISVIGQGLECGEKMFRIPAGFSPDVHVMPHSFRTRARMSVLCCIQICPQTGAACVNFRGLHQLENHVRPYPS